MNTTDASALENINFDGEGFLTDPTEWNRDVAHALAQKNGVGHLTALHWRAIDYVREHYFAHHTLPVARVLCHELGADKHCMTDLFGHNLAPLWRIAGLPNPGEEALVYVHNL